MDTPSCVALLPHQQPRLTLPPPGGTDHSYVSQPFTGKALSTCLEFFWTFPGRYRPDIPPQDCLFRGRLIIFVHTQHGRRYLQAERLDVVC